MLVPSTAEKSGEKNAKKHRMSVLVRLGPDQLPGA